MSCHFFINVHETRSKTCLLLTELLNETNTTPSLMTSLCYTMCEVGVAVNADAVAVNADAVAVNADAVAVNVIIYYSDIQLFVSVLVHLLHWKQETPCQENNT